MKLILTRSGVVLAIALIAREETLKNLVGSGAYIVFRQQGETKDVHGRA